MTVIDTSAVVDLLVGEEAAGTVQSLFLDERTLAAPDVIVFEVLAVLRRLVRRGSIAPERATGAIEDLGDLSIETFPSMPLRRRAWDLRDNFTAADGLFVALAERLGEPLASKDRGLLSSAREHAGIPTVPIG